VLTAIIAAMKIAQVMMVKPGLHLFGSLANRNIRKLLKTSRLVNVKIMFTSLLLSLSSIFDRPNPGKLNSLKKLDQRKSLLEVYTFSGKGGASTSSKRRLTLRRAVLA